MRLSGRCGFCYSLFRIIQWIAVAGLAVFGGAQPFNAANWSSLWIVEAITWLQAWGKLAIPCLTAAMVLARGVCSSIGPPWVWSAIHAVLNEFREHAFHDRAASDPVHYHRVTLFKHVRFKWWLPPGLGRRWLWPWGRKGWPWSGWLVPVARSGHTTMGHGTVFLAPDNADDAEGVAGQTWATNGTLAVTNLPSLEGSPTPAEIADYAKRSFVPGGWVESRLGKRACPRSLHGIPVEVKGKLWGVLILDSRFEEGIKVARLNRLISTLLVVLDKLLERVK